MEVSGPQTVSPHGTGVGPQVLVLGALTWEQGGRKEGGVQRSEICWLAQGRSCVELMLSPHLFTSAHLLDQRSQSQKTVGTGQAGSNVWS